MRAAGASISLPFPRRRRRSSIRRRLAPVRQDGEHHGERGGERDEHVAQRTHHRIENEAGGATQPVSHPWEVRRQPVAGFAQTSGWSQRAGGDTWGHRRERSAGGQGQGADSGIPCRMVFRLDLSQSEAASTPGAHTSHLPPSVTLSHVATRKHAPSTREENSLTDWVRAVFHVQS